uniref:PH domain-containing protein n=1 Tax=Eiseniibacteriota bacterium TaxID=2212470 RepID=A0A832MMF1_UNCEI
MNATPPGTDAGRDGGAPLEWTYNPWRERPGLAVAGTALALGVCAVVGALGEGPLLSAGLAAAGVASLAPLFVPARCRVGADGVARRGPLGWSRRPWAAIRRAVAGPGGLLVSPYTRRHWLDPWRAMFLPLPSARRAVLLAALRSRLEDHGLGR